MSMTIMAIGIAIPFTVLGDYLGFTHLPALFWPLLGYIVLTQTVKIFLLRKLLI